MKKKNIVYFLILMTTACAPKWKDPDQQSHKKPRYCYRTLGKIMCYETPQKCLGQNVSGYQGNPPPKKLSF